MKQTAGIYCVDDEVWITKALLFLLNSKLRGREYHVEAFNEPLEAAEIIDDNAEHGIDPLVFIVDFQMPGMRGDEFVRKMKRTYPQSKIIMLSGNSNVLLVSELEEEGLMDYYISKPWSRDEFLATLNNCLPLNLKFD
jgi:FixJ family two-component response regulator